MSETNKDNTMAYVIGHLINKIYHISFNSQENNFYRCVQKHK